MKNAVVALCICRSFISVELRRCSWRGSTDPPRITSIGIDWTVDGDAPAFFKQLNGVECRQLSVLSLSAAFDIVNNNNNQLVLGCYRRLYTEVSNVCKLVTTSSPSLAVACRVRRSPVLGTILFPPLYVSAVSSDQMQKQTHSNLRLPLQWLRLLWQISTSTDAEDACRKKLIHTHSYSYICLKNQVDTSQQEYRRQNELQQQSSMSPCTTFFTINNDLLT